MSRALPMLRAVFWGAVVFTVVSAVAPSRHVPNLIPWDKAVHFIAFYVLTVLAAAAFPRRPLLLIAAALSAFGAVIEVVQGLKIVARDRDFWDWVADTIAISAALGPVLLAAWRNGFRSPESAEKSA